MRKRCHFSELTQPLPGHRTWRVDSGLVSAATYCPGGAFMQATNCMGAHGNPEYKGLGQGLLPLSKGWSINRSHSALGPSGVISLEGSDLWRRVEGGKKKKTLSAKESGITERLGAISPHGKTRPPSSRKHIFGTQMPASGRPMECLPCAFLSICSLPHHGFSGTY